MSLINRLNKQKVINNLIIGKEQRYQRKCMNTWQVDKTRLYNVLLTRMFSEYKLQLIDSHYFIQHSKITPSLQGFAKNRCDICFFIQKQ